MMAHPSDNLPRSLHLWPQGKKPFPIEEDGEFPTLTVYLPSPEHRSGHTVVILPGGGYWLVSSAKEGHRPAQFLNAHGIAAAVLEYRHSPQRHPIPLIDAQRAIRVVRAWARAHGLRDDRVGIMGFSAGGHLAGCAATQPLEPAGLIGDEYDAENSRPDFVVLAYPVVSLCENFTHTGSRDNLLGSNPDTALVESLSVDRSVTPETPPMFLFHTQEDGAVPVANSIALFQSLTRNGVPCELHVYPHGAHGIGFAANHPWTQALLAWILSR